MDHSLVLKWVVAILKTTDTYEHLVDIGFNCKKYWVLTTSCPQDPSKRDWGEDIDLEVVNWAEENRVR